ncbi:hypothetical protein [Bradyrhizobium vignae]|uniref:Uncharacterized protein n=1 Tax=Bradyrhizobium vignae TaxID=1549949 RepID=A0ABS3ZYI9_9BRAD|nr:hypothetical protein [Bradyrhizobium vignae]MBP0112768.1 hypothetical protein [Bradyrhizobium vignae]
MTRFVCSRAISSIFGRCLLNVVATSSASVPSAMASSQRRPFDLASNALVPAKHREQNSLALGLLELAGWIRGKGDRKLSVRSKLLTIQIDPLDLLTLRAAPAQVGLLPIRPIAIFLRHLQQSLLRPRLAGQSSLRSGQPLQ